MFSALSTVFNIKRHGAYIQPQTLARGSSLSIAVYHFDIILYFPVYYRHVIWASSSAGKSTFPGLADAYANAESSGKSSDWDKVHYHLSVLTQAIDGAANTLVDVI